MNDLRTEAAMLLDLLTERLSVLQQVADHQVEVDRTAATSTPDPAGSPDAAPGGGVCAACGHDPNASSCSGCPICALLAMVRGERPELTARLVDGARTMLIGLRSLLGDFPPAGTTPADGAGDDAAAGSAPAAEPAADVRAADEPAADDPTQTVPPSRWRPAERIEIR
jgi:hypothetical protein